MGVLRGRGQQRQKKVRRSICGQMLAFMSSSAHLKAIHADRPEVARAIPKAGEICRRILRFFI